MPNKTIYLDTIKEMEEELGAPFINREEVAKKLQDAWNNDKTNEKRSYLTAYSEVFCSVLKQWSERELSIAYNTRGKEGANLQNALLKTDNALKVCALSLLPELRENPTVLFHMTFGSMKPDRLKREFIAVGRKYAEINEATAAMQKRREMAYAKYKEEWKNTPIRKITELVRDTDAVATMTLDEKIDYAMALNLYLKENKYDKDKNLPRPLGENEVGWIEDALTDWKKEIGCEVNEPVDEAAVSQYTIYGKKLSRGDGFDAKILSAVAEYNKIPNKAAKEIKEYKELEEATAEIKRVSEQTVRTEGLTDEAIEAFDDFFNADERAQELARREAKRMKESTSPAAEFTDEAAENLGEFFRQEEREINKVKERVVKNEGITDDAAEMVGDLFTQAELEQDIDDIQKSAQRKEREYLGEEVKSFNQKYAMRVNNDKLRTSAEQVAGLMIKAREEKERFMSKESIVVIENGEEKCYEAKEYFKDLIKEATQKYLDKVAKLEEERAEAEKKHNETLDRIKNQASLLDQVTIERLNLDAEKALYGKNVDIDKEIAAAKAVLQEDLSITQGGLVIEKNGKTVRRYKASQYYETHETKKEQEAYGEYQQMYARVYKDACKSLKEQNYAKGKVTDFAAIAKDVDKLFKSAMYISNVYDNEKNVELMQKCSFGGFSPEQLAAFTAENEKDPWALNQSSEEAWMMQKAQAKNILSQWTAEEKRNPKVKPSDRIKATLDNKRALFAQGKISRKEMLDYMIATDAHFQRRFSTRWQRFSSFIQYNREKNALKDCLVAVGVKDNAALRVEMNLEYTKMAQSMSKEQVFKSIEETVNGTPTFQKEKEALAREHQIIQDRKVAEETAQLEQLKTSGREPLSIPDLDERKNILNTEPRSPQINPNMDLHKNKTLQQ